MGASFIGSLTQIAKGKITAVTIGAAGVGVLNQVTTVWSLFAVIAGLGFYTGMVRHLAQNWNDNNTTRFRCHMSSSYLFLLCFALLVAAAGCFSSAAISTLVFADSGQHAGYICLALLSVPIFVMGQLYRAMLNASKSVPSLVKARIGADVASVIALAILIYPFGLKGAVLGYIALHLLFLLFGAFYTRKTLGPEYLLPSPGLFQWSEIRLNAGFGANGMAVVITGILTTLIISRAIIEGEGLAENGIYTMALKVATVYLGALSASAAGYYLPSLSAARKDENFF